MYFHFLPKLFLINFMFKDSSSSTSHFLSDLESVLGDSADFTFANSLIKTPEKLFHSIAPMMAMNQHLKKTPPPSQVRPPLSPPGVLKNLY